MTHHVDPDVERIRHCLKMGWTADLYDITKLLALYDELKSKLDAIVERDEKMEGEWAAIDAAFERNLSEVHLLKEAMDNLSKTLKS